MVRGHSSAFPLSACIHILTEWPLPELQFVCSFLGVTTIWFYFPLPRSGDLASSFSRFLDHIQRRDTVGRTPLDEWSVRRRDLYLTTYNTHNRHVVHTSGGIRTHNLSGRAAVDLRLRPRGHWDRHLSCSKQWNPSIGSGSQSQDLTVGIWRLCTSLNTRSSDWDIPEPEFTKRQRDPLLKLNLRRFWNVAKSDH